MSPDAAVADGLDAGGDVADFAGQELLDRLHARREDADAGDVKRFPARHRPDLRARRDLAVPDTDISDDAEVGIKMAVEDQGPQRLVGIALRRRDAADDGFQYFLGADALFGRRPDRLGGVNRQHFFDLLGHPVGIGGGQVNLVDDRDDLQMIVQSKVDIRQRLRLDSLGGIHDQYRAFAGGK